MGHEKMYSDNAGSLYFLYPDLNLANGQQTKNNIQYKEYEKGLSVPQNRTEVWREDNVY